MSRIIMFVIILTMIFPLNILAAGESADVKASFIRDRNLWVFINGKEQQITNSGNIYNKPKWSHDGMWILYQVEVPSELQKGELQVEIWAYELESGKKKKIYYDGYSPTWAPNENIIAFNDAGILDISDFKRFYNIATGVHGYTWLPDGSGFLLSSSGDLKPDGWSSAILYKKKVNKNYEDIVLFGGVEHFFTLPREVGLNDNKVISVYADHFAFSPSNRWISFIVSPTASWSMDSNMLCVIASNGKNFTVLDEVIFGVGEPKWAPTKDTIAFIAGGGRIVLGFKNKDLKVQEMPASGTYTPENYADLDFDWVSDQAIVTSRIEEREWSNDFSEHPLPTLYSINIDDNKQMQITKPPGGYGDYNPRYVKSLGQLVWLRGTSISNEDRVVWKANRDGSNAEEWIKNVDQIEFY
ncbi:TolB family protein [Calidifontibacillus oryziterrae]|uniref:TolB family protein n=1 Tax=Calidifontibacillus oryziterrae TaxID=1191699 RepID=UPI000362E91D|nr:hypothetical protein [Calidifontibacillus oryziterrae]